ncbi:hypothetical protein ACFQ1E_11070 [Sphingomonas canadensis]|uniref:Uncharacterized protein n=1 Tax=Sphingomonas canadensis TaxID=1219257 RepID=A0ABW3H5Z0_9SPHN|nr:hypothetical protein [Sphingomonas canadensis]MCW3836339.1 hypothetical protein [Sphingomonas canadensis]
MRVLIEVLHIVIGLCAAILIGALASWSYPLAADDIWLVTYVALAAVAVMGIGPLRRAYAADRAKLDAEAGGKDG